MRFLVSAYGEMRAYLPLFTWWTRQVYPNCTISVIGDSELGGVAADFILCPVETMKPGYAAATRFFCESGENGLVFITDVDVLVAPGLEEYAKARMTGEDYFAFHGVRRKPHRPEITGAGRWEGKFERLCGAWFAAMPRWYLRTKPFREDALDKLKAGTMESYREVDEVVLCRLCKSAGYDIPGSKYFPPDLRGVHLGDFKFDRRWQDNGKMTERLTIENCEAVIAKRASPEFKKGIATLCLTPGTVLVIKNFNSYLVSRCGIGLLGV
ncbi:MAG: hypothetical protein ABIH23_20090 [bacterium]